MGAQVISATATDTLNLFGPSVQIDAITIRAISTSVGGKITLKRNTSGTTDWNMDVNTDALRIFDSGGNVRLTFAAGARPSITGSRGGNVALANLLTALAGMSLITNSTSA